MPEAVPHCVRVALSELLLSGVTTLADLSMAHPGWLDLLAEAGMRVCIAPMFRSGRWYTKNGHMVEYAWDEAAGEKAMAEALSLIERAEQHPSGRLFGMVVPAQIDTCTEGLLRDSVQRGQGARRVLADPRGAIGQRVPRDHPPAWLYADRLAGSSRAAVGAVDHRARHFPGRSSVDALAHRYGCEAAGGDRHDGRALSDRVRAARDHAEGFRPLSAGGREHGRRDRHLSAQHAG